MHLTIPGKKHLYNIYVSNAALWILNGLTPDARYKMQPTNAATQQYKMHSWIPHMDNQENSVVVI